jgi:peptidoglycan/xylan/chitin deacetylase (PgdA/CDA1 family)
MKLRGKARLKRWLQRAIAPWQSEVVILLYHRVFEPRSDPQRLCVSPKHFARHLEHLGRHYRVMTLQEAGRSLREGRMPKRGVVITFDDGYADNLLNAKPLLERYETPATVFVVTGYVGSEREFWWDELERLLLWTPQLPEKLQVTLNGSIYDWHLDGCELFSEDEKILYKQWNVELSGDPTLRHRYYRELTRWLRSMGEEEQLSVLAQLRTQSEDDGKGRTDYLAMTPEEICRLAEGGLVGIGAHTMTHSVLATQSVEMQQKGIRESKQHLEAILGRPVTAFSYPYGGKGDIGEETVRLVREASYEEACANFPSPVTRRSDPLFLPRYLVRDWDGEEFEKRLSGFF